ncbi:MAG: MraY family glycosyltransferase, partial [Clostridia bacterium]
MDKIEMMIVLWALAAFAAAGIIAFATTPIVKILAQKVGAMDVPKDSRRMHKVPIPRMGGLAIFLGFLFSVLLFVDINRQMQGILIGAVVIVVLGIVDDIMPLNALLKLIVQIFAALIVVYHGTQISIFSNPNIFSDNPYISLGMWSVPITVIWIVAITNAVNLIDGLDGLAVGVSSIASFSLLIIAIIVSERNVALIMAALAGACIGFMPYNINPAKIFMGDTGSTFLGFILATISIQGLFKFYALVSFAVPFLILGLPIFDTMFAIGRRVIHGKSPMSPDRGHVHHRLID